MAQATETRIITKRLRDRPEDSWTLAGFTASGGYDALRKALTMEPSAITMPHDRSMPAVSTISVWPMAMTPSTSPPCPTMGAV